MSISLAPIADVTNRCSRPYDLEGIGRTNDILSSSNAFVSGVVPGSIFRPLFFTFYVNDLPAACPEFIIKLHADNSKAYKIITRLDDRNLFQFSLNKLDIWA